MARSLIGGLLQDGYNPANIQVCEPDPKQREQLKQRFDIMVGDNGADIIPNCDCIVFAVKPQTLADVANATREWLGQQHSPLFISIAAGVREQTLARWLQRKHAIVRCMPNTPALIQAGATALYANEHVSTEQRNLAESILRAVGLTLWVDAEETLDAVTAVSGSGPAYIFLVIEAMQAAAEATGLNSEQARLLCLQTAFGAARMALEDSEPVSLLRERVTSKGGTTERALEIFKQAGLTGIFEKAIMAAAERSRELAEELDRS